MGKADRNRQQSARERIAAQQAAARRAERRTALHGMSWAQVAAAIKDPSSTVGKDIDGGANMITAAICKLTKNQPAAVCSSAAAQAGTGGL